MLVVLAQQPAATVMPLDSLLFVQRAAPSYTQRL
jgi:hypothetical protein